MCKTQGTSRGRIPSVKEIERIVGAPFSFSPFGLDLEEIMTHERSINPGAQVSPLYLASSASTFFFA